MKGTYKKQKSIKVSIEKTGLFIIVEIKTPKKAIDLLLPSTLNMEEAKAYIKMYLLELLEQDIQL